MVLDHVWTVHTVLINEVRPTDAVYTDQPSAEARAQELSTWEEVLAAGVVRHKINTPNSRKNIVAFVSGARQATPYISDCRLIHIGGAAGK